MSILVIGREDVRRHLGYGQCIPLIAEAMIALSQGRTRQLLRGIVDLEEGRAFGVMPGAMGTDAPFGAKLVSVYPGNFALGRQSHQGMVAIFDPASGAPVAILHAGEITAIRTAAASAVATDALARPDARRMAVLGYGEQAAAHIEAIAEVRALERVTLWGRSAGRARALADRLGARPGPRIAVAASVAEAVEDADIICTTTAAAAPILMGEQVPAGCHVNLVGSSRAGPAEADEALVARARFFADHRDSVLKQGAEFLNAKAAGLIGDDHVLGEIGQVLDGSLPGRLSAGDVTVYKSLGSIVQDIACGWFLYAKARDEGFGGIVPF